MSHTFRKPERIASAIYLITGFFADEEPIKWKLRNCALDMVSLGAGDPVTRVHGALAEASSLLVVARNAGLVSDTNFEIMSKEISGYGDSMGLPEGVSGGVSGLNLSHKFFGPPSEIRSKPEHVLLGNDIGRIEVPGYSHPTADTAGVQKDSSTSKGQLNAHSEGSIESSKVTTAKKGKRREIILDTVGRKKEIMIKDIIPLIVGVSEKTIQRELLSMVKARILKKEGEKRWSRYKLA